jgi:hypothetical protein
MSDSEELTITVYAEPDVEIEPDPELDLAPEVQIPLEPPDPDDPFVVFVRAPGELHDRDTLLQIDDLASRPERRRRPLSIVVDVEQRLTADDFDAIRDLGKRADVVNVDVYARRRR